MKLYEESGGKVLLLAVVEGLADVLDDSWIGNVDGTNNSNKGDRRTPGEIAAIRGSARDIKRVADDEGVTEDRGSAAAFVHATIFPGSGFIFAGKCNVLVLGEDKTQAERHLVQLQVGAWWRLARRSAKIEGEKAFKKRTTPEHSSHPCLFSFWLRTM